MRNLLATLFMLDGCTNVLLGEACRLPADLTSSEARGEKKRGAQAESQSNTLQINQAELLMLCLHRSCVFNCESVAYLPLEEYSREIILSWIIGNVLCV